MNSFFKFYALASSVLIMLLIIQNQQLKNNSGIVVIADLSTYYPFPTDNAPIIGNPNAPISVVTFLDYEWQGCAGLEAAMYELMAKYPDKIKWAYKHQ